MHLLVEWGKSALKYHKFPKLVNFEIHISSTVKHFNNLWGNIPKNKWDKKIKDK